MSYVLERNEEEYERLRRQALMWEPATARLLDRIGLAPGATCLVVMEHDMGNVAVVPPLESTTEFFRVVLGTFAAGGSDTELGRKLPLLHEEAGIGPVDGADVIGRLEPLSVDAAMYEAIYRSMLPAAVELGVTTRARGERWFGDFERDVAEHGERRAVWPVMVGTWRRK